MPEVMVASPATPTLAAIAPPPSDPGTAKAALARNTVTTADPPVPLEITPAISHTPAPPPTGEAQTWTKDICEICWLPVKGKRPSSPKKQNQKRPQQEEDEDDEEPKKNKLWKNWFTKLSKKRAQKTQSPEETVEEYWIELPCKHRFGSECLKEWKRTEDEAAAARPVAIGQIKNQCPTCKKGYLHHTCHRRSRWRIVRGYRAAKRIVTLAPPQICVKCELDAIDESLREKTPFWDTGFATIFVGIVKIMIITHNQKYGYEPLSRRRQFALRHLPKRWLGAMERSWNTRVQIGTDANIKGVTVQALDGRKRRKPSRKEKKEFRRQRRIRRKQRRQVLRRKSVNNAGRNGRLASGPAGSPANRRVNARAQSTACQVGPPQVRLSAPVAHNVVANAN